MQQITTTNADAQAIPMLYKLPEVATILKISLRKLHELTASGELAVIRVDKRVRISSVEILSFIERNTQRVGMLQ